MGTSKRSPVLTGKYFVGLKSTKYLLFYTKNVVKRYRELLQGFCDSDVPHYRTPPSILTEFKTMPFISFKLSTCAWTTITVPVFAPADRRNKHHHLSGQRRHLPHRSLAVGLLNFPEPGNYACASSRQRMFAAENNKTRPVCPNFGQRTFVIATTRMTPVVGRKLYRLRDIGPFALSSSTTSVLHFAVACAILPL